MSKLNGKQFINKNKPVQTVVQSSINQFKNNNQSLQYSAKNLKEGKVFLDLLNLVLDKKESITGPENAIKNGSDLVWVR